ncbi:unnamed protein product [Pleuronectes platessa]|uniref:Uncharacterized protein n=1 Tax=Pleuronectes platessa TaxID=8262 RepID=A0A9N7YFX7_PLEPL|nr:unnamed protein product [Pleuronectes platessa]
MKLERRHLALTALMNSRESRWNDDMRRMQAEIASLEIELRNAKAMQGVDSGYIQFLTNLSKKQQVDVQNMQEELIDYRMKVEAVTREKEELMDTFESIMDLEKQRWSERLEKDVCIQRIEELESVVEATERNVVQLAGGLKKNVELKEKLETMQTQIQPSATD